MFTSSKVFKKLRKLKPDTASGPGGIQAVLLKNAGSSLSFPLAQLYQFFIVHLLCAQGMETCIGNAHFQKS